MKRTRIHQHASEPVGGQFYAVCPWSFLVCGMLTRGLVTVLMCGAAPLICAEVLVEKRS